MNDLISPIRPLAIITIVKAEDLQAAAERE